MVSIVPASETFGCAQTIKMSLAFFQNTCLKIFCRISVAPVVPAVFLFPFVEKTVMTVTFKRLLTTFVIYSQQCLQHICKIGEHFLPM